MVANAQELCREGRWVDALELLDADSAHSALDPDDSELLATAAFLTGRHEQAVAVLESTHVQWLEAGEIPRAARTLFWLGMTLVDQGQFAPAMGWFGRGQSLLVEAGIDAPEAALFAVPRAIQQLESDANASLEAFETVLAAGNKHGDREIAAMGRLGIGRARVRIGDVAGGVAMFDEALAAAVAGDVTPIMVGNIYCAVIRECRNIFDVRRAREWTRTLSAWCDRQQGLVPFRGQCLIHRSEIAQIDGDWEAAWAEIEVACDRVDGSGEDWLRGMALHQRAELHRLRGEFVEAQEDYGQAAALGWPTEPGVQLLQLAMGEIDAASAAIRRSLTEAHRPTQRARLLAACVDIMLAVGDVPAAREAATELGGLAVEAESPVLRGSAAQCDGAVLLAENDTEAALLSLATAADIWQSLGSPYDSAVVRLLRAQACERVGDTATADLERSAGEQVLAGLGAVVPTSATQPPVPLGGLSRREVEVIRLLATGMTNKQMAAELVISQKTVDRHVSNIFTKIGVTSRSAATAWAINKGVARA